MTINDILDYASQYGLVVRGGFVVADQDNVPDIGADAAQSLILFGNAGSSLWECFSASDEYLDGNPEPLDRWSERIGNRIADLFGGLALFPFGEPPYQPFLQWASRSESLYLSRLGMLIHPQYGLWHAYRFAVALPTVPDGMVKVEADQDICARCPDQPCLSMLSGRCVYRTALRHRTMLRLPQWGPTEFVFNRGLCSQTGLP